jgi:hypothetical protein
VLRRVVKDHSDIKKSLMMRTKISVWNLKESTIGHSQLAIRDVFPGMPRLCRMSHNPFLALVGAYGMPSNRQAYSFILITRS